MHGIDDVQVSASLSGPCMVIHRLGSGRDQCHRHLTIKDLSNLNSDRQLAVFQNIVSAS
jgi:hypothetical protein